VSLVDKAPPVGGYRYRDEDLNIVHTTSAPQSDEQALHYFNLVTDWFKDLKVRFIEKREPGSTEYHYMQFYFDGEKVISK